jgi:hypothetical protein
MYGAKTMGRNRVVMDTAGGDEKLAFAESTELESGRWKVAPTAENAATVPS